nr:MAG TPA: hypothetical protein [Caudoviricetes sp.]
MIEIVLFIFVVLNLKHIVNNKTMKHGTEI